LLHPEEQGDEGSAASVIFDELQIPRYAPDDHNKLRLLRHLRHVQIESGLRQQRRQLECLEAISRDLRLTIQARFGFDGFSTAFELVKKLLRRFEVWFLVP